MSADAPVLPASFGYGSGISENSTGSLSAPTPGSNPVLPNDFLQTTSVSTAGIANSGLSELVLGAAGSLTIASNADVAPESWRRLRFCRWARDYCERGSVRGRRPNLFANHPRLRSLYASTANALSSQGALGSYDININGTLSVAGQWVNNFDATSTTYQSPAWLNGGSITMQVASDILVASSGSVDSTGATAAKNADATTTDISGSIFINTESMLNLAGGGAVNTKGSLNLTAKGGNLTLESDTGYFQLAEWDGQDANVPGFRVIDFAVAPTVVGNIPKTRRRKSTPKWSSIRIPLRRRALAAAERSPWLRQSLPSAPALPPTAPAHCCQWISFQRLASGPSTLFRTRRHCCPTHLREARP